MFRRRAISLRNVNGQETLEKATKINSKKRPFLRLLVLSASQLGLPTPSALSLLFISSYRTLTVAIHL